MEPRADELRLDIERRVLEQVRRLLDREQRCVALCVVLVEPQERRACVAARIRVRRVGDGNEGGDDGLAVVEVVPLVEQGA